MQITFKDGHANITFETKIREQFGFQVDLDKPLSPDLIEIHENEPYVLSDLIDELEGYLFQYRLTPYQQKLIDHAIGGLKIVINGLPLSFDDVSE